VRTHVRFTRIIPQPEATEQGCRGWREVTGFEATGAGIRMQTTIVTMMERFRFAAYGFAAGVFVGLILGWMFHGFVGILVRLLIVAVILGPFIAALVFWFKVSNRNRVDRSPIQDAEWRDINSRG
jgi:F0F1-type ATP synthase assembly protein I